MKNTFSIQSRWLRPGLFFSVAGFLLSFFLILMVTGTEHIGEIQVSQPNPPYIGNPGEIWLQTQCWRHPGRKQLQIESASDNLNFSETHLCLAGISLKGFRWRFSRLFWAVEFGEYRTLDVTYGPVKQRLSLQLKILPRPDLNALETPPPPPAPGGKILPVLICIAILAMLSDLLLAIGRWRQPHNRALRQLKTLRANTAGCDGLWQILHEFSAPSSLRSWLASEIRKMQFSPEGLTLERFRLCKALLTSEIVLY